MLQNLAAYAQISGGLVSFSFRREFSPLTGTRGCQTHAGLPTGIAAPHHRQIVNAPIAAAIRAGKCQMTRSGFAVALTVLSATVAGALQEVIK